MNLVITQAPLNGILGGPFRKEFALSNNGIGYTISVVQEVVRKIEIFSDKADNASDILGIYYRIITLLMLFDGQFYPVIEAIEDGIDITHSMKKRELASYKSADFMLGSGNTLLDPFQLLSANLVNAREDLETELDLVHKMFLYCVSAVKMPVDMKCAFLIETYIGLAELIASRKADFILPDVGKRESKLKKYLIEVIGRCGQEIFETEQKVGIEAFSAVLKESRNRIAHIKAKQGKLFLDGKESVLYLCKLSMLYRMILFDLLEIPPKLYESNVKRRVETLDQWNGVLHDFMERLKEHM